MSAAEKVRVLQLTLHDTVVGHLAGFQGGRNALVFDEGFRHNPDRSTFSLITHAGFPGVDALLSEHWVRHQRLHPTLSNRLPAHLQDAIEKACRRGQKPSIRRSGKSAPEPSLWGTSDLWDSQCRRNFVTY